jgi:hypothetical protein
MTIIDYAQVAGLLIRTWVHEGIECAMARSPMNGVNGYVRIPKGVELPRDEEYGLIDLDVHGGVQYGPDQDGWIGFDTGHAFDVWLDPEVPEDHLHRTLREIGVDDPRTNMEVMGDGFTQIWTLERLEAEVNHLAIQVYAIQRTE